MQYIITITERPIPMMHSITLSLRVENSSSIMWKTIPTKKRRDKNESKITISKWRPFALCGFKYMWIDSLYEMSIFYWYSLSSASFSENFLICLLFNASFKLFSCFIDVSSSSSSSSLWFYYQNMLENEINYNLEILVRISHFLFRSAVDTRHYFIILITNFNR